MKVRPMKKLGTFLRNDDGAVTVDWVVLCALIVALTGLASQMMRDGATGLADNTSTYMNNQDPN